MRVEIVTKEKEYGLKGQETAVKKIKITPESIQDRNQLKDLFWNCRYGKPPLIVTSVDTDNWNECVLILKDQ